MTDIDKIINQNREYFKNLPISITDYKSVDLSTDNIALSEIIDLILWSTLLKKKSSRRIK